MSFADIFFPEIGDRIRKKQAEELAIEKAKQEIQKSTGEETPAGQTPGIKELLATDQTVGKNYDSRIQQLFNSSIPQAQATATAQDIALNGTPAGSPTFIPPRPAPTAPDLNMGLSIGDNMKLANIASTQVLPDLRKQQIATSKQQELAAKQKTGTIGEFLPNLTDEQIAQQYPGATRDTPMSAAISAKRAQGSAQSLTPQALDLASNQLLATGQMPALGFGGASAKILIMNEAAKKAAANGNTAQSIAYNQAAYKAATGELSTLQKNRGTISPFLDLANKNLDLAQAMSDKVDRTGVPIINKWLLAGRRAVMGDPDVTNFDAALRTAINEYGKITQTVTGGGTTAYAAAQDIEKLLNEAQTKEQVTSVISNVLKPEIQNRVTSYDDQIARIKQSMTNGYNPGVVVPRTEVNPSATQQTGGIKGKTKSGLGYTVIP